MDTRIKISEKETRKIYADLKDEGYSLRDIREEIDIDFRNCLYKGHSLSERSFQKLRSFYDGSIKYEEIKHTNGKESPDIVELTKSSDLADFIGIMLGDGHLRKNSGQRKKTSSQNYLCITLHEEEKKLAKRTERLCQKITDKEPKKYNLKGSRAVQIKIHSKEVVEELVDLGLQLGDKVENQVGVPAWIKSNENYSKSCLRGLVDTDGTIYRQKRDNRKIIRFKNHSFTLLDDFEDLCEEIDVKTTKGGGKYSIQIGDQKEVEKFIGKVKPLKAQNI